LTVGLVLAHAVLGHFLPKGSILALSYALVVTVAAIGVSVWRREPQWALCAAAYIVGADVFWRLTQAGVLWEMGKLAVSLTLLAGMVRQRRVGIPLAALVYLSLLIPSVITTLVTQPGEDGRGLVTANFSGPFTLFVCWAYCSKSVRIDRSQMITILTCLILPLVAVGMRALAGIASSDIMWAKSSSAASGGFGPNQVSAMLGLGAFASLVILVLSDSLWRRIFFGVLFLWFASQSVLTFSRTGFYLLVLGSVAAGLFLLRNPATRLKFVAYLLIAGLAATFLIYPFLNRLTGQALSERFANTTLTGRTEIAAADLAIWRENWLLGTGVGQAAFARADFGFEGYNAHTEYTRLLAEHGLLGFGALGALLATIGRSFWRQRGLSRALAAGMLAWALAFMAVSAMRLAAPSFLIGLSLAGLAMDPVRKKARAPTRLAGSKAAGIGLLVRRGLRKGVTGGFSR
jgi:O-antigen ligase